MTQTPKGEEAPAKGRKGGVGRQFVLASTASCGAVTITNVFDILRVRLQLQGELQAGATRTYKGVLNCLGSLLKNEGAGALARGLGAGYAYQIATNGTRLAVYDPICNAISTHTNAEGVAVRLAGGAVAGAFGAVLGSPFQLVKTRLQARTASGALTAAGTRHYKGVWDALVSVVREEGPLGLFRGSPTNVARIVVASAVQLATFDGLRAHLARRSGKRASDPGVVAAASVVAGVAVVAAINPIDVVLTRLYNAAPGAYAGALDCVTRTVASEGLPALYKGAVPHALKVAPQTSLTLIMLEALRRACAAADL